MGMVEHMAPDPGQLRINSTLLITYSLGEASACHIGSTGGYIWEQSALEGTVGVTEWYQKGGGAPCFCTGGCDWLVHRLAGN